jgi:hypothetical protein
VAQQAAAAATAASAASNPLLSPSLKAPMPFTSNADTLITTLEGVLIEIECLQEELKKRVLDSGMDHLLILCLYLLI